jgi:hypothetical protein
MLLSRKNMPSEKESNLTREKLIYISKNRGQPSGHALALEI